MTIKTPADVGAIIREQRTRLGIGQQAVAAKAGISRKTVVEIEQGKPGISLGLILRTLRALDISLQAETRAQRPGRKGHSSSSPDDLNDLIASMKRNNG